MDCELLPSEVYVAASKAIPVVEALPGTIAEVHFGLEQLATEMVVHDQGSHRALTPRWIGGRPFRCIRRIAGIKTPRCSNGGP